MVDLSQCNTDEDFCLVDMLKRYTDANFCVQRNTELKIKFSSTKFSNPFLTFI